MRVPTLAGREASRARLLEVFRRSQESALAVWPDEPWEAAARAALQVPRVWERLAVQPRLPEELAGARR